MRKFELIYDDIRKKISSYVIKAGEQIPIEIELMEKYQVSRPTVSKALKKLEEEGLLIRRPGLGTFVNEDNSSSMRSLIFGMAFPEYSSGEVFEPITSSLKAFSKSRNYNLLWGLKNDHSNRFSSYEMTSLVNEYLEQQVDGVFFAPWESDDKTFDINKCALDRLREHNIPVVLIDRDYCQYPERSEYPLVCIDNMKAGYLMTEHFVKQGRDRIDFMWYPYNAYAIQQRLRGYRAALLENGIIPNKSWIHFGGPENKDFVIKTLDSGAKNIICGNDEYAALCMNTLRELDMRIPQAVRISGFDDIKYSRLISVPLTTIHQPVKEIAKKAVEIMFSLQKGNVEYASYTTLIDCYLVERESSIVPKESY